ncbi:hypothetical protein HBH89_252540, partial [Parastagonospora nodorum]
MAHQDTQQNVQEDHPDDNRAPANACDQCCRRKTGCSKEHPKCQRCEEDGRMCTYSIRRGAGRPRKMSKHNIDQFASPKRDLTSQFPSSCATQTATPHSEPSLSTPTPFSQSGEKLYFDLNYAANQSIALNSYSQAPHYWNEDPPLVPQQPDWISPSALERVQERTPSGNCSCVVSLLESLRSMTPIEYFNDATKTVSPE